MLSGRSVRGGAANQMLDPTSESRAFTCGSARRFGKRRHEDQQHTLASRTVALRAVVRLRDDEGEEHF